MKAWRSVCGPTGLLMPALRASRRTIRQAAWRSSRCPSRPRKIGVAIEARHGGQPSSDRRPSAATGFEVAGEALEVAPAHAERTQAVLRAPRDELAQVQGVGLPGDSPVGGEERGQRVALSVGELGVDDCDRGRWNGGGHVAPPDQAETWRPEPPGPQLHVGSVNVGTICRGRRRRSPPSPNAPTAESVTPVCAISTSGRDCQVAAEGVGIVRGSIDNAVRREQSAASGDRSSHPGASSP
jgi:hypothetical protein